MKYTNWLWIGAIAIAAGLGSVPALLALVAVFLMELVIEAKAIRITVETIAEVFAIDPEVMTEEHAEQVTEGVMERIRDEMTANAQRRPH